MTVIDGSVAVGRSWLAVVVLLLGNVVVGLRGVVHWGRLVIDGLGVVNRLCMSVGSNGSTSVSTIVSDVGWQGA